MEVSRKQQIGEEDLTMFSAGAFLFEIVKILFLTYGKASAIRLKVRFKNSTLLRPLLVSLSDLDNVHISRGVFIHAGLVLRILGNCQLYVGEDTYIGPNSHISGTYGTIAIGKKVMIADNVLISTACHKYQDVSVPIKDQGYAPKGDIIISDGSWIGEGSTILPGVRVGENSVVGANSVVTRDVPSFSVVAGSPARVIRQYNKDLKKWIDKP